MNLTLWRIRGQYFNIKQSEQLQQKIVHNKINNLYLGAPILWSLPPSTQCIEALHRPLLQWSFGKGPYFSSDFYNQQFQGAILLMVLPGLGILTIWCGGNEKEQHVHGIHNCKPAGGRVWASAVLNGGGLEQRRAHNCKISGVSGSHDPPQCSSFMFSRD